MKRRNQGNTTTPVMFTFLKAKEGQEQKTERGSRR